MAQTSMASNRMQSTVHRTSYHDESVQGSDFTKPRISISVYNRSTNRDISGNAGSIFMSKL